MRGETSPGVSTKMLKKTHISDMYVGNFYDVSKILISTQNVPYLLIDAKRYIPISILLLKHNVANPWVLSMILKEVSNLIAVFI